MDTLEDNDVPIKTILQRQEECGGNYLHNGPLYPALWRYVAYRTGVYKNFKRIGDKPHYQQAEGLLCEKCINDLGAYRLPKRK